MNRLRLCVSTRDLVRSMVVLGMLLALMAGLTGPAVAQGPSTSVQYVGVADATGIYVAVVDVGAGVISVYLCDGDSVSVWLEGTAQNGSFQVTGQDGSTGSGTIAGGTATGTATLADGTMLTFSAPQASLPAGLYQRSAMENGEPLRARTIVLPDGTARGMRVVFPCGQSETNYSKYRGLARTSPSAADRVLYAAMADGELADSRAVGCTWSFTPPT